MENWGFREDQFFLGKVSPIQEIFLRIYPPPPHVAKLSFIFWVFFSIQKGQIFSFWEILDLGGIQFSLKGLLYARDPFEYLFDPQIFIFGYFFLHKRSDSRLLQAFWEIMDSRKIKILFGKKSLIYKRFFLNYLMPSSPPPPPIYFSRYYFPHKRCNFRFVVSFMANFGFKEG